jgi:monoamine oxidase
MHGRRKSPLARAYREHAQAERRRGSEDPPFGFEETLERLERPGITRRDALKAGGLLSAGLALAACTPSNNETAASATAPASTTPHDARVVVVGAGLAGMTAAYRLSQAGVPVRLYEARDRLGGRCWTARGFADGQTAEHGGEFIDTRHVHIRQLARDLGLGLDDLWKGYAAGAGYPRIVDGKELSVATTKPVMERVNAAAMASARSIGLVDANGKIDMKAITYPSATVAAVTMDQLSMEEWLDANVHGVVGSDVGDWLDEVMCGWYGLNLSDLSALNWMDYSVIPAPGADERWHVHGGNDRIISGVAGRLPADTVTMNAALTAVRRSGDGSYELTFDGVGGPVVADLVILTLPMTTLRQVDLSAAGFSEQKTAAIRDLAMGYDVKLLLQYDRRPSTFDRWGGGMEYADPDFVTWESSVVQPGTAGLVTVYAGGRTGASWTADTPHGPGPTSLVTDILGRIDQGVPGSASHYNGRSWADLWTRDPWTNGAYAAFGPGQYTRFWGGTAEADGNVHFAGEATSTYSQGYLNGGVESGDRAAQEVLQKLGLPIPASLAKLPH